MREMKKRWCEESNVLGVILSSATVDVMTKENLSNFSVPVKCDYFNSVCLSPRKKVKWPNTTKVIRK